MSRQINLDLKKPLEKADPIDLQYALDRNLMSKADAERVNRFLQGDKKANDQQEFNQEQEEEQAELLAILKGSVGEVNARVEDEELSEDEVQFLIDAEKSDKDRKGVVEFLESVLESFSEEEEDDDRTEGDEG